MESSNDSNDDAAGDERWILFFGDGSSETQTLLSQILWIATKGPILIAFLERSRQALSEERSKVSLSVKDSLPSFQRSLEDFLGEPGKGQQTPALHPAEIVVTQIACFIHR